MTDNTEWVPCGIAYMVIGDEFARRLACDPQEGRRIAATELIVLLEMGKIEAKAEKRDFDLLVEDEAEVRRSNMKCLNKYGVNLNEMLFDFIPDDKEDGFPEITKYEGSGLIPKEFWTYVDTGQILGPDSPNNDPVDWAIGTLKTNFGYASGVSLNTDGLPCADAVRAFMGLRAPTARQEALPPATRVGRLPGGGWPAFAEELAMHIHHVGAPAGHPLRPAAGDGQPRQWRD